MPLLHLALYRNITIFLKTYKLPHDNSKSSNVFEHVKPCHIFLVGYITKEFLVYLDGHIEYIHKVTCTIFVEYLYCQYLYVLVDGHWIKFRDIIISNNVWTLSFTYLRTHIIILLGPKWKWKIYNISLEYIINGRRTYWFSSFVLEYTHFKIPMVIPTYNYGKIGVILF